MQEILNNTPIILTALLACSTATSLIVEAIKKMTTVKKPNILAAIVAVIVGAGASIAYIVLRGIAVDAKVIVVVVTFIILCWLCSMLGYDKIYQTIMQLKGKE